MPYTDESRSSDFDFFVDHFNDFYHQYGHCFLAIQNGTVLGSFPTVADAVEQLSPEHSFGTYIIQECSDDTSAYITNVFQHKTGETL